MAFIGSFLTGVATAIKAGGAISALPGASTAAKIGIGVGKFAVAAAPVAKVGAVVGAGLAAKSLLTQATPSTSLISPTPEAPSFEGAQEKTRAEQLRDLRRKRAGTILTSPQGLLEPVSTTGKTLLGA